MFIDACDSDLASDFKQAIFQSKASVIAGWSDKVSTNKSPEVAKFFFDRFLGANKVAPEADGFQQRAFDYLQAGGRLDPLPDAWYHDMNDQDPASQVKFTSNPAQTQTSFGQLAPSIALELPIEVSSPFYPFPAGTLQITGTFGSDPRPDPDSKVTVGGLDCPVQAAGWKPDEILCDLPSGATGDVVVTVRKHQSNKARLTKWNGTFRYAVRGTDTLQVDITHRVSFRADVRKVRLAIHEPPAGPFGLLTGTHIPDESSASYACSGRAVTTSESGTTNDITWTGSGNVPASRVLPEAANSFHMGLNGLPGLNVDVGISYGTGPGCDWVLVTTLSDGTTIRQSGRWMFDVLPGFDIGALPVEPNDPSFPANFRNLTGRPGCYSPPTLTGAPQCRMEWDRIVAVFPPDPNSAR